MFFGLSAKNINIIFLCDLCPFAVSIFFKMTAEPEVKIGKEIYRKDAKDAKRLICFCIPLRRRNAKRK